MELCTSPARGLKMVARPPFDATAMLNCAEFVKDYSMDIRYLRLRELLQTNVLTSDRSWSTCSARSKVWRRDRRETGG